MVAATRTKDPYHKNINKPTAKPSHRPPLEQARSSIKPTTEKIKEKEPCNKQLLEKDKADGQSQPFFFKVLTQLANIPVKIWLYELLRLLRDT